MQLMRTLADAMYYAAIGGVLIGNLHLVWVQGPDLSHVTLMSNSRTPEEGWFTDFGWVGRCPAGEQVRVQVELISGERLDSGLLARCPRRILVQGHRLIIVP